MWASKSRIWEGESIWVWLFQLAGGDQFRRSIKAVMLYDNMPFSSSRAVTARIGLILRNFTGLYSSLYSRSFDHLELLQVAVDMVKLSRPQPSFSPLLLRHKFRKLSAVGASGRCEVL